jgi:hypothetical protein
MRIGQQLGIKASWWGAAVERGDRALGRRAARTRRDEQHDNASVAIVLSLFLALLTAALLVGGGSVINPLMKVAVEAPDANRLGEIVLTMGDGAFCRHFSFDNVTGELTEQAMQRCTVDVSRERPRAALGFTWGSAH